MTSLKLFEQTVDAYNLKVTDIYKFSFTAKETEMFTEMMIAFAKLHVDSALNKANENVKYDYSDIESIQNLILTAYPLDCIV